MKEETAAALSKACSTNCCKHYFTLNMSFDNAPYSSLGLGWNWKDVRAALGTIFFALILHAVRPSTRTLLLHLLDEQSTASLQIK